MSKARFAEAMSEAILSLPQDMKAVLRIVEDPELDDASRALAAGALLQIISLSNTIPGVRGTLALVGDVILLRLVLERLEDTAPEVMDKHAEESPELMDPIPDQMEAVRAYLGEKLKVLEKQIEGLPEIKHEGYSPAECIGNQEGANWLYDTVQEAIYTSDFEEDEVRRELRAGVQQILPKLEQRLTV